MPAEFDVVIVGSGFGGAITACRLAQAGRSVCVLERGKRWSKGEFPSRLLDIMRRGIWNEQKSYGLLDYRTFEGIEVLQGCGVGGGSLHYYNVNLRAIEEVIFATGRWPAAIQHGVLDPYYSLAEEMLQSRPLTPPTGFGWPARTNAFLQATAAAGREGWRIPLAVKFSAPLTATEAPTQSTCDYRGECLTGCNRHAKQSVDLNYLRLAERCYGAEVRPLCLAYNLEPLNDGRVRVHYKQFDPCSPGKHACWSIIARQVVLAAGTLGTTELLLCCRDLYGTLPRLTPMLGRHFSANGDYAYAGGLMPFGVHPTYGPSITAGADFSTPHHSIFIEDLGLSPTLEALFQFTVHRNERLFTAVRNNIAKRAGNATSHERPLEHTSHLQGKIDCFLPLLAMGIDAGDGVMRLHNNCVYVDWNNAGSEGLYCAMRAAMQHICRCAGGEFRETLWLQTTPARLLTAHPLGGCVMGDRPQNSVVDHRGRVWGYPQLFVADGSIVPSALAVNPSLTISALAERVAFWMIHSREMEPGDPQTPANC